MRALLVRAKARANERESVPSVFETLQPAAPGSVVDLTELTVTRLA